MHISSIARARFSLSNRDDALEGITPFDEKKTTLTINANSASKGLVCQRTPQTTVTRRAELQSKQTNLDFPPRDEV
jgi:hypothetical protein